MTVTASEPGRRASTRATSLGFSARTDYGLRALLELAAAFDRSPQRRLTSEQVAAGQELPAKYLEGILASLVEAGVLDSARGTGGGYRLARPPEEVSLWAVVTALEGEMPTVRGLPVGALEYPGSAANLTGLWRSVASAMHQALDDWTLRDLLDSTDPPPGARRAWR